MPEVKSEQIEKKEPSGCFSAVKGIFIVIMIPILVIGGYLTTRAIISSSAYKKAIEFEQADDYEQAAVYAKRAAQNWGNYDKYYLLTRMYIASGNYDQAVSVGEKTYRKAHKKEQKLEILTTLTEIQFARWEFNEAVKWAKKVIELDEDNQWAQEIIEQAEELGDIRRYIDPGINTALKPAIQEAQRFIQENPTDVEQYFQLAFLYESDNDWEGAAAVMLALLQQSPDNLRAQYEYGRIMYYLKNNEAARAALLGAKNNGFNSPELYLLLGKTYEKSGELTKAIEYYNTALSLNSDLSTARQALSRALYFTGNFEAARSAIDGGSPDDPDMLNLLGSLAYERGEVDTAKRYWAHADISRQNKSEEVIYNEDICDTVYNFKSDVIKKFIKPGEEILYRVYGYIKPPTSVDKPLHYVVIFTTHRILICRWEFSKDWKTHIRNAAGLLSDIANITTMNYTLNVLAGSESGIYFDESGLQISSGNINPISTGIGLLSDITVGTVDFIDTVRRDIESSVPPESIEVYSKSYSDVFVWEVLNLDPNEGRDKRVKIRDVEDYLKYEQEKNRALLYIVQKDGTSFWKSSKEYIVINTPNVPRIIAIMHQHCPGE